MGEVDIDELVETYVSTALDLVGERRRMAHNEFEEIVWEGVSARMGIPKENVVYLHHCFHWTFFNREEDSPLRYIQPKGKGGVPMVALNGRQTDKSALMNYILKNYKEPYLTIRAKQL